MTEHTCLPSSHAETFSLLIPIRSQGREYAQNQLYSVGYAKLRVETVCLCAHRPRPKDQVAGNLMARPSPEEPLHKVGLQLRQAQTLFQFSPFFLRDCISVYCHGHLL